MSEATRAIAPASQAVQRSTGSGARREHNRRLFRGALGKTKPANTKNCILEEPETTEMSESTGSGHTGLEAGARVDLLA